MNEEQYKRVVKIFNEAADLAAEARPIFLDRACEGDEILRSNVERLLIQDTETGSSKDIEHELGMGQKLLAGAMKKDQEEAGVDGSTAPPDTFPGKIGRYIINNKIAEGGMGAVYLAEQDYPQRTVALKMIRPGVFSKETLKRFKFEAELLGMLQHPGIAQIYEAGEAQVDSGNQPFFAMEYIDGLELRQYAVKHDLDVQARLELVARVCDAVNHAHQKGIIHRDLKPDNILVVEEAATTGLSSTDFSRLGQPKVLDFGVARVTNSDVKITTMHTDMGKLIGTLTYMSPEQVTGDSRALDTRSDIYSLGVILYELLVGHPPLDLQRKSIPEAARIIREDEPTRIGSVVAAFRGDIDAILCKALEKDRERRYASATALSEDIRRFLSHQPITARPPTLTYQLSRFIRRNKGFVAGTILAFLCLATGLVLALLSQKDEAMQRAVAEKQTKEARRSTYAAKIQAVMAYHIAGDNRAARQQLFTTSPEMHGWEREYLYNTMQEDIYFYPMNIKSVPLWNAKSEETQALFPVEENCLRLFDFKTRKWSDHHYPGESAEVKGAVALMPDGRSALWGDEQGCVMVLDLHEGRAPRQVLKTEAPIRSIFIAPNGNRAAICSLKTVDQPLLTMHLLDLEAFQVKSIARSLSFFSWLAFSPDSSRLATAMHDGSVHFWNAESLDRLQIFKGHEGPVRHVCFSQSGRHIASSGYDRTIRIWSFETDRPPKVLGPVRYQAETMTFLWDDKMLLTGHADARICYWNIETGACERVTSDQNSPDPSSSAIQHLSIGHDDGLIYAVGLDGVHIRSIREPFPKIIRHGVNLHSYAYDVDFSPDGRQLASAGWDGTVRICDVATGRLIAVLDNPENTLWAKYSPDGKRLLICSQSGFPDRILSLWNVATLRKERELKYTYTNACGLFATKCDAIILGVEAELWIVDPLTLAVRKKIATSAPVWSLASSPDGMHFSYGMENGRIEILDTQSLAPILSIEAHAAGVQAMAFSQDGKRLATGGKDAVIRIFDVMSKEELLRIETPDAMEQFTLCFSTDGRRILSGSRQVSIGVWDAESGMELVRLHGHEDYVHALALSPDGRILASASGDNTVRLWDARPLKERIEEKDRVINTERAICGKVESLFEKLVTIEKVIAAIEADHALSPLEKHAAWNLAHLTRLR